MIGIKTRMRPIALLGLLALLMSWTGAVSAYAEGYSSFLELRVYPVTDQERFLEYFEEHYLESQEVLGMRIWGQFRDLEAPDQFVWMRGYRSMEERLKGLSTFYTSPVWMETGGEALSMLRGRVSHVHLLEPLSEGVGFSPSWGRPALSSEVPVEQSEGVVVAQVFSAEGDPAVVADAVRSTVVPQFEAGGGVPLGLFRSTDQPNNFPMLAVIEDEPVIVLFATFESQEHYARMSESLEGPPRLETFILAPGERSRLRHRPGS